MADLRLRIKNSSGGLSDDDQYGPDMSFSEGLAINFRQAPGILTLMRRLQAESEDVVTTEVHDAVRIAGGEVILAGGTKIYSRTPGAGGAPGSYSVDSEDDALRNVADLDYRPDLDLLFLIDDTTIHEKSPIVGGDSEYVYNKYREYVVNAQTGSGGSYDLPTQVEEDQAWTFELEREPIFSVNLTVGTKGTGDWTVVLHDGANHEIGRATVQNSLITDPGFDTVFPFDVPLRGKLDASYHVHVFSSDGSGTIQTDNTNTLARAQASLKASRLVDTGIFGHATLQIGARTIICNERYIAEWEPLDVTDNATAGYDPHRLVLPSEVIAVGTCEWSEYTMIACALKRGTDANNDAPTEGIIFSWNNTDDFIGSFKIPVPQGVPYSLYSTNNTIWWIAVGTWYRWAGGDPEPIFQFPGVDRMIASESGPQHDTYLRAGRRVLAGNPDNTVSAGFPYLTANTSVRMGVFSFGRSKAFMPPAVSYDGLISTDTEHTQFLAGQPVSGITLVKRFGGNLLVAWRDIVDGQIAYGVDYVNDTSPAASVGKYGTLWFDNDDPDKEKTPKTVKVTLKEALPAGCSVTPYVRFDREDVEIEGATLTAEAGKMETVFALKGTRRFYDVIVGVILRSSEGNFPYIKPPTFKFDDGKKDQNDTEVARDWPSSGSQ